MNIGQFNSRGPHNGIENWFDLIHNELVRQGHNVRQFWLRGKQPTREDVEWMDFALYHFSQVALFYRSLGVPFCILPSANDCFPDNGTKLNIAASHKNCRFVTYQSYYHLRKYKEWNIPKPKVYVPMPARVNQFVRKKELGDKILAGGRLVPKKGLDRIIPYIDNLTIFGDGPLKDSLQSMNENTKFVGRVNDETLIKLMEESWIYLFPAIITPDGDSEGISNTIKEAMLMELQVVCTPIAGNKELENVIHLSDWSNIKEFISNIQKQRNWKGRQEILKTYSPKSCVHRLLKGINENK